MVEFMVIASMWESMAAWFTPTVLFCVTNLIIATIFIASNNQHLHAHSNSTSRIARVSSLLNRARSIDFSSYTTAELQQQYPSQFKTANYSSSSPLAQSIHFSPNYVTPPDLSVGEDLSQSESERDAVTQPARAPSLFERVRSIKFSSDYRENAFIVDSNQISNAPGSLARAPSSLDRVKSFKISSAFTSGPASTQSENVGRDPSHKIGSKSEKTYSAKKSLTELKKSRSEMRIAPNDEDVVDRRRPATARERQNDFDEVDAKADDFIARFKQQLKLQRLESLVRYNEMLNRRS